MVRRSVEDSYSKTPMEVCRRPLMEVIPENKKESRDKALDEVKKCNMIDPSILELKAFKIIQEEYSSGIRKGPDYICNICM